MKLFLPCTLAVCFAGLSAAFWVIELREQVFPAILLAVVASVVVSGLTFVCAYYARTVSLLLIAPAIIFGAADTYQNAMGYQALMSLTVSEDVTAAKESLQSAQAKLDNLPTPDANGAIRKNETYQETVATLTTLRDDAEARYAELSAPTSPTEMVLMVMLAIQIALAATFALFGKRNTEEQATAKTEEAAAPAELPQNVVQIGSRPQMDAASAKAWAEIAK